MTQEGSIAPEALSEDKRLITRPLRYEPEGHNAGPAIKDANGQLVATLFWPCHEVAETVRADGELHLIASRWVDAANAIDTDDDQVYELGKRDGYMEAVQDIDLRTGGDGEFYGSTIPGRGMDVPTMLEGIVERFEANVAPAPVQTGAVGSVPGWKLVPVEPTLEMWKAFFRHCSDRHEPYMAEFHTWTGDFGNFVASYDYMLSASPSPRVGGGECTEERGAVSGQDSEAIDCALEPTGAGANSTTPIPSVDDGRG